MSKVPKEDIKIFREIRLVVEELPDVEFGKGPDGEPIVISCHMLTRALAEYFPVKAKDGFMVNIWQHSWLETKGGFIIDPYPIALVGGPILVVAKDSPWGSFYKKYLHGSFPDLMQEPFLSQVKLLTKVMGDTIERIHLQLRSA
ncbi:hypothetical protein HY250_02695 [Candidatus Azambacteria bacterium]|nr:hypothetical protein [Candidatus Azambacteria bacterium]MBI3685289.1 hypothetical protein [Candidatus Azambacteria bacterium]